MQVAVTHGGFAVTQPVMSHVYRSASLFFYMAVGLSYGECSFVECNPDLSSSLVSLLPQRRHPLLNPRPWRGDQRKRLLCLGYVSGDLGGGSYV